MAQSELGVITKSKKLSEYIITITEKSPKRFRFTLVSRLQNYSLDIIERLILANEIFVDADGLSGAKERLTLQNDNAACRDGKARTSRWTGSPGL